MGRAQKKLILSLLPGTKKPVQPADRQLAASCSGEVQLQACFRTCFILQIL